MTNDKTSHPVRPVNPVLMRILRKEVDLGSSIRTLLNRTVKRTRRFSDRYETFIVRELDGRKVAFNVIGYSLDQLNMAVADWRANDTGETLQSVMQAYDALAGTELRIVSEPHVNSKRVESEYDKISFGVRDVALRLGWSHGTLYAIEVSLKEKPLFWPRGEVYSAFADSLALYVGTEQLPDEGIPGYTPVKLSL